MSLIFIDIHIPTVENKSRRVDNVGILCYYTSRKNVMSGFKICENLM